MGIKRYYATADNTITNAYKENLRTRATASNIGASDILEVFSIYGQANSSSAEKSRVLIQFSTSASTNSIKADRDAGTIPSSGSVSFYLRMFNAPHGQTLPKSYTMDISAVSGSWTEGTGLDMELYKDIGVSNWISSSAGDFKNWVTEGGDYYTDMSSSFSASFDGGTEDIEMDITTLVEQWVSSSNLGWKEDNGVGVFISSEYEDAARSYYTKKFFARGTEFFFKQPYIEARWNSSIEDDRANTYYSSSLATGEENLNTLYLYNYFRGRLRNIPGVGTGNIYVSIFSGSSEQPGQPTRALELVVDGNHVTHASRNKVITGSHESKGVYKASFALTGTAPPLTALFDVWFSGAAEVASAYESTEQYYTASFSPRTLRPSAIAPTNEYVASISNLRSSYRPDETARFRVYTRQKDWNPTIYTKAVAAPELHTVESGSFQIFRIIDELKAIPHGTGSTKHTFLSYDASGSYFDLDMSMLESGYAYGINLAFYNEDIGDYVDQPETFKFKIG